MGAQTTPVCLSWAVLNIKYNFVHMTSVTGGYISHTRKPFKGEENT